MWVDRHASLALWSNRNAFVVCSVGVRLGSHTPLNPGTGLYKDEEYRMVISFVYILFTSKLPFHRHFTHSDMVPILPIQKLIHNEMAMTEKVLSLRFGVKSLYDVRGHLQDSRGQVTVLA